MADEPDKEPSGAKDKDAKAKDEASNSAKKKTSKDLPSWSGKGRSKKKEKAKAKEAAAEEDAFQRGVKQAGQAASSRWPVVIGGIAALVAVIGGGVYWYNARLGNAAAGTKVLAQLAGLESRTLIDDPEVLLGGRDLVPPNPIIATEEERDQQVESALAALAEVNHAPTEHLGELIAAARLLRKGQGEDAQAKYEAFLAAEGEDHPLAFLAVEGKGFALEAQGDLEGALNMFETLAGNQGDFYRDMALYQQGRVLERLERSDDALAVYRQYVDEYPPSEHSMAQEQIKARLEELDPSVLEGLIDSQAEAFEIDGGGVPPMPPGAP